MKSSLRLCLAVLAVSSAFAFVGCGDDDDATNPNNNNNSGGQGGDGSEGSAKCEEIAELCHPVDDGDGPLHNCHEQSEVGNAAKCEQIYANCIAICRAAYDNGAGGGSSDAVAGAGGVAAGGGAPGTAAGAGGVAAVGGAGGADVVSGAGAGGAP